MSKYGVISGPYFPVLSPNIGKYGPETTPYLDTFYAVSWDGISYTKNIGETSQLSQLICCASQLTGFYMRAILTFNGLSKFNRINEIQFPVKSSENHSLFDHW